MSQKPKRPWGNKRHHMAVQNSSRGNGFNPVSVWMVTWHLLNLNAMFQPFLLGCACCTPTHPS